MRPVAEKKKKQRILHPALLRGREWCVHHLPKSQHLHPWVIRLRSACSYACRLVWRGPGWAGRLLGWRLLRLLRPPSATSRPRHCRRRPGGGSSCTPGQDVPDCLSLLLCSREPLGEVLHRVAEDTGTRGHSGTVPCLPPSCRPDTARGGVPGTPWWTSHGPETAL